MVNPTGDPWETIWNILPKGWGSQCTDSPPLIFHWLRAVHRTINCHARWPAMCPESPETENCWWLQQNTTGVYWNDECQDPGREPKHLLLYQQRTGNELTHDLRICTATISHQVRMLWRSSGLSRSEWEVRCMNGRPRFLLHLFCGLQNDWSTENQKKKKKAKSLNLVHRLLCAMCCHQSEMNCCGFAGLIRNVLERYR